MRQNSPCNWPLSGNAPSFNSASSFPTLFVAISIPKPTTMARIKTSVPRFLSSFILPLSFRTESRNLLLFQKHQEMSPLRSTWQNRSAMRLDEFCRVHPSARVFAITGTDERRDEFAHLEMKMGEVTGFGGSDSRNLLAALHCLTRVHQHVLHVPIIRFHIPPFAVFQIRVEQNDNVAPAGAAVAGEQDASVSDRVNRIAEVAVLAADSIQVVAEMFVL